MESGEPHAPSAPHPLHRPMLRLLERPAAPHPAPQPSAAPAPLSWPARVQHWFDRLMAS